jgi:UDP-glucose:(heptosyl)LPS alpha-1,3-glucosyltransferase
MVTSGTRPSSTNPRIAIAFRSIGGIGGANDIIATHAREFVNLGYQVDLIGEKVNKAGVSADMGRPVRVIRLPLVKRFKWRWFAARADSIIRRGGYDFVAGHGHNTRHNVLSMHNCLHLTHEYITGRALDPVGRLAEIHDTIFAQDSFALCICNSKLMQDDIATRYGVERARLPIVYPGYHPEKFNRHDRARYRETVRAELGGGDDLLIGLVTSGDFVNRGLDILLEAYASLDMEQRLASRLVVLGKQRGTQRFLQQARELGIADRVHFAGTTDCIERYFHALDLCVHPAHCESFGMTVQEAMACGIPVLSTRRVGAMERLPRSAYASLLEAPTVKGLGAQLRMLIDSPETRSRWAEIGYESVVGNTQQASFETTLQLYYQAGLPVN